MQMLLMLVTTDADVNDYCCSAAALLLVDHAFCGQLLTLLMLMLANTDADTARDNVFHLF